MAEHDRLDLKHRTVDRHRRDTEGRIVIIMSVYGRESLTHSKSWEAARGRIGSIAP
jgi:hypothetical protein